MRVRWEVGVWGRVGREGAGIVVVVVVGVVGVGVVVVGCCCWRGRWVGGIRWGKGVVGMGVGCMGVGRWELVEVEGEDGGCWRVVGKVRAEFVVGWGRVGGELGGRRE